MNDRMAATNRIWNILAVLSPVLMGFGASTGWSQGYTEVVSMTWNFSTAANPLGWYPIVSLSNFGISNGSLGYTATSSIYTIYSPPISVPTTALQRVEIVMSSNTSGAAKVFWAPAQTGVYNGFQPGDENDFTMIGDGVPHTYFLPINTSSASTIYGLRLDVPPSAAVSIQSVVLSNLQAPIGAGVSPLWQFNTNGNMQGWVIYSGTLDTSVAGGTLNLKTYSNATILAPQAQVTNQLEWFSLMGSVTQTSLETPWLQFNFVSTANNGAPTSSYVPLVPDSAEHVYNQNVGGASGWYSMVSQLSLTLSENTTFAISQIQISTAPQGSADLTVDAFGPATSLIRVGSPFQISCRASDRGNQPVQGLSASLNLPSDGSVQVLSSPSVPSSISNGYPQTLVWTLTSSKAGEVPISVSATSQSGGSAQVSKTFLVNPAVAPQSFPYVPPPIPALSNYDVGIYYFPGWSLNSHWDPIRYFPERTPVLGYYAEGNSQVIDWQIKWAAEHGVKFFAVDWYWYGPSMPSTEQGEQPNNFLNAYFSSAYQNFMKFCLAYAGNQSAVIAGSTSEFLSIAQTWITKYFSQPEYYTINGTPVVFVINPDILDANLGGSANSALAAARQLAKSAGFKGIYFIAATYPGQASQYAADGYDALSAYNYSSAGTSDPDESPYSEMVSGYPSVWDSLAGSTDIPYIIPTSPGWDLRPWATFDAPNELVRTGSTPELFQQMLQAAKTSIDSGAGPKVMLVEAWNELGEGSFVEPTSGQGFSYLDAIQNVFVGTTPVDDIGPADVGLPLIETLDSTDLWTFTDPSDLLPWQVSPGPPFYGYTINVSNSQITNNQWTFTSNGNPDLVRMGFDLSAQEYSGIAIQLSVSSNAYVTVYWGAADEPGISALRNSGFEAQAGSMQTYTLNLAGQPGWHGNLDLMRITLTCSSPTNVAIQSIQFIPTSTTPTIAVSRSQLHFTWAPGAPVPASQMISISSANSSNLPWTATASAPWLSLSASTGTVPANIAVSANTNGFVVGVYNAAITIGVPGAANSPLTIPVTFSVTPAPGTTASSANFPSITNEPASETVATGSTAKLSVATNGSGVAYQWNFNGVAIAGATSSSLTITGASAANTGSYTCTVSNTVGLVTSDPASLTVVNMVNSSRLINISTRAQVGTGGNILIPGFVIGGSGMETLLIRADGPSLTAFGVSGVLAQPSLSVTNSAGTVVASNTGWGSNTNSSLIASTAVAVGAFALASGSADCALIVSLPPGAYTVQVSGAGNTTGVALAEVYEVSSNGTRLINISTRAPVGTGSNILIPGFVIGGSGNEELLVRADGPSLTSFGVTGVLAQPSLTVINNTGTTVASNSSWGTNSNSSQIASTAASVGAFALTSGSADSATIVNLTPGAYTMQVSGVNNSIGIALAEVYEVPNN